MTEYVWESEDRFRSVEFDPADGLLGVFTPNEGWDVALDKKAAINLAAKLLEYGTRIE